MVEEYGGVVRFSAPIVPSGANAFLAAEKALQEPALRRPNEHRSCGRSNRRMGWQQGRAEQLPVRE
jgi:hypothetical protein